MTREEIRSILVLTLEMVRRAFSKFQDEGVVLVHNRQIQIQIQITDPVSLQRIVDACGS